MKRSEQADKLKVVKRILKLSSFKQVLAFRLKKLNLNWWHYFIICRTLNLRVLGGSRVVVLVCMTRSKNRIGLFSGMTWGLMPIYDKAQCGWCVRVKREKERNEGISRPSGNSGPKTDKNEKPNEHSAAQIVHCKNKSNYLISKSRHILNLALFPQTK